jgi:PAS domain S-box-containing protein
MDGLSVAALAYENAEIGMAVATRDAVFLHVNEAFARMMGRAAGELGETAVVECVHVDDREQLARGLRHAHAHGGGHRLGVRVLRPDGSVERQRWTVSKVAGSEPPSILIVADGVGDATGDLHGREPDRQRLRAILDGIPAAVGVYAADGTILESNQSPLERGGMARESVIGKKVWELPTFRNVEGGSQRARSVILAAASGETVRVELSASVRDHLEAFEIIVAPLTRVDGKVTELIGFAVNISERKRAEAALRASLAEKDTLLREVHHRVKNNLQVVSSLLALQSSALRDEALRALLDESQNRVRAMAMVHEQLYQSKDLAQLDMSAHLRSLCALVAQSHRSRVTATIVTPAAALVPLDTAVPLGIVINELLSNAYKHAFPEDAPGNVSVACSWEDGSLVLCVEDDGVGLRDDFDSASAKTLGLRIVRGLVDQLGGELEFRREHGTKVTVRVPAPGLGSP